MLSSHLVITCRFIRSTINLYALTLFAKVNLLSFAQMIWRVLNDIHWELAASENCESIVNVLLAPPFAFANKVSPLNFYGKKDFFCWLIKLNAIVRWYGVF